MATEGKRDRMIVSMRVTHCINDTLSSSTDSKDTYVGRTMEFRVAVEDKNGLEMYGTFDLPLKEWYGEFWKIEDIGCCCDCDCDREDDFYEERWIEFHNCKCEGCGKMYLNILPRFFDSLRTTFKAHPSLDINMDTKYDWAFELSEHYEMQYASGNWVCGTVSASATFDDVNANSLGSGLNLDHLIREFSVEDSREC